MERYLILMNLAFYALLALTAMYANDKLKEHEEKIKQLEKKFPVKLRNQPKRS